MTSSVTLIGPGAIGTTLAAALIQAGTTPTIAARTRFTRLKVEWPDLIVDADVTCVLSASDLTPSDVVIVATKATQNGAIADHLAATLAPGSTLVVAQNGVDHRERFPDLGDDITVLPAIPMLPAQRQGPGHTIVGGVSKLVVPAGPEADAVAALFADSPVEIEATSEWISAAWFKLMMNASSGAIGVLTRRGSEVFVDVEAQALMLEIMEEVATVGRAEGANLPDDLPTKIQQRHAANAGSHVSSIVVDRINGTGTEWRERNDVVARLAARHGIDVPVNTMLTTLMRLGEPDPEYRTADSASSPE